MSTTAAVVRRPRSMIRSGMSVGAATTFASVANYLSNVVLARELSPRAFADAALLVSGLLLVSAVALGFQLNVARALASGHGHGALVRARHRAAVTGTALAAAVAVASPMLASVFNMASAIPLVILAAGIPIFFQASVGRGAAQANREFGRLAASIGIEALVRVVAITGMLTLGMGPAGVALALTAAFAAAVVPCWKLAGAPATSVPSVAGNGAVMATLLLLLAQVVIANSDVWIVAARLPEDAGRYAAVALIGRLVFVTASSIVTVVFPALVAGGGTSNRLLWRALSLMAAFGGTLTFGAFLLGERLVAGMMGSQYAGVGHLLWPYALATTLFVLANMFAISGVAIGRSLTPGFLAVGAATQLIVLTVGAGNGLAWVVWAQVAIMLGVVITMCGATVVAAAMSRRPSTTRIPTERSTAATLAA